MAVSDDGGRVVHVVEKGREPPLYLGDRKILARTVWGGSLVVPSFNVDVALGVVRDGIIEPWTTRLVQELAGEGDTVINVGANFGYHTILAAYRVGPLGKVISVEANPHIVPYLINSIFWSGVPDRVTVFHCAAWDESGPELNFQFSPAYLGGGSASELWADPSEVPRSELWVDPSEVPTSDTLDGAIWDHRLAQVSATSTCRLLYGRDILVPFKVHARKIDDICEKIQAAHLLHMDIEGAEAFAIRGARELINRSPNLRIIFEWSAHRYVAGTEAARSAFKELWRWFGEQGFNVRKLETRLGDDGGIFLSAPVTFDHMCQDANGDYVAVRPHNDPWK